MECLLVVDRDFFAGPDISQSKEQDMPVQSSHEGVWLAGVIDVVRAVAATRAVQTETTIDIADAQDLSITCAPTGFEIRDPLARVLSYLLSMLEMNGSEAALPIDRRFVDRKAVREVELHQARLYESSERG